MEQTKKNEEPPWTAQRDMQHSSNSAEMRMMDILRGSGRGVAFSSHAFLGRRAEHPLQRQREAF